MKSALFLFVVAFGAQGCSLVVDTRCFEGECQDGSVDAMLDVTQLDDAAETAPPTEGGTDAGADAAPDANDVCLKFTLDPCRNIAKGYGGCYCGTSNQSGFDFASANSQCIYRCNDTTTPAHTDSVKFCGGACTTAPPGTEDYCSSASACTVGLQYCYDHCTD